MSSGPGSGWTSIPPALIATGSTAAGPLAAVRDLGRAGITVWIGKTGFASPVRHSRYATGKTSYSTRATYADQVAAIVAFGRRTEGGPLLTASDEGAWLAAREAATFRAHGVSVHAPAPAVIEGVLRKDVMTAWAESAGIPVPRTWNPRTLAEVEAIDVDPRQPLVVKPRSHFTNRHWRKGALARSTAELVTAYRAVQADAGHISDGRAVEGADDWPIVQEYHEASRDEVYNLTGFVTPGAEQSAFLANRKVMQYPRTFGVGCAFEAAPVDEALRDGLLRLARERGYHGIVEAEFVTGPAGRMLVDFNPRIFHGYGFTVARGLPLARLHYFSALGDNDEVSRLLAHARAREGSGPKAWCLSLPFHTMLVAQSLSGRMPLRETARWLRWRWAPGRRVAPGIADLRDPLPSIAETAEFALRFVRDPGYAGTFLAR